MSIKKIDKFNLKIKLKLNLQNIKMIFYCHPSEIRFTNNTLFENTECDFIENINIRRECVIILNAIMICNNKDKFKDINLNYGVFAYLTKLMICVRDKLRKYTNLMCVPEMIKELGKIYPINSPQILSQLNRAINISKKRIKSKKEIEKQKRKYEEL
jgi:hypothetical protein